MVKYSGKKLKTFNLDGFPFSNCNFASCFEKRCRYQKQFFCPTSEAPRGKSMARAGNGEPVIFPRRSNGQDRLPGCAAGHDSRQVSVASKEENATGRTGLGWVSPGTNEIGPFSTVPRCTFRREFTSPCHFHGILDLTKINRYLSIASKFTFFCFIAPKVTDSL